MKTEQTRDALSPLLLMVMNPILCTFDVLIMICNSTEQRRNHHRTLPDIQTYLSFFGVHVTVHRDKFLIINKIYALISQILFLDSNSTGSGWKCVPS
jgi:hypothetical protein